MPAYITRRILPLLEPVGPRRTGPDEFSFSLWAPNAQSIDLHLLAPDGMTVDRTLPMTREGEYWRANATGTADGRLYRFCIDGALRRGDPASRSQPMGVHGPSAVVDIPPLDHGFTAPPLQDMVIYELHVGAFTPQGTFDAAIDRLDHLAGLGVNAVELMPLAQCPGERNWGYDGVYLFAVQHNFGGAAGLQRFVQACHAKGLAVLLDVVYNHLGPEGNYLREFAPYFTPRYSTPWGEAVNFDGRYSDGVRNLVLENARHWLQDHGIDGLRIDAVHAIYDSRPDHILADLAMLAEELGQSRPTRAVLIAESHDNDPRLITSLEQGGLGMDAVWNDDFHHSAHALLTGEDQGYYADYGSLGHLVRSMGAGFSYTGQYSHYRKRRHGLAADHLPGHCFVNWLQTHDMVGNRLHGDRLATLLEADSLRLAAAILLLSPGVPMLFMGEEWGETHPFLYFTDHGDEQLIENVRKGRIREFASFAWQGTPPDPQAEETYRRSLLDWRKPDAPEHAQTMEYYRTLLGLRREHAALRCQDRNKTTISEENGVIRMDRQDQSGRERLLCLFNTTGENRIAELPADASGGEWRILLHSASSAWGGELACQESCLEDQEAPPLPPFSAVLLQK